MKGFRLLRGFQNFLTVERFSVFSSCWKAFLWFFDCWKVSDFPQSKFWIFIGKIFEDFSPNSPQKIHLFVFSSAASLMRHVIIESPSSWLIWNSKFHINAIKSFAIHPIVHSRAKRKKKLFKKRKKIVMREDHARRQSEGGKN